MDVSDAPIKRVLAIYPCEALPDLAFHAPILPKYPPGADVEEDATLGCHQGASLNRDLSPTPTRELDSTPTLTLWLLVTLIAACRFFYS